MNKLVENSKYIVLGEVALSECMNLKVMMSYVEKISSAISYDDLMYAIPEDMKPTIHTLEDKMQNSIKQLDTVAEWAKHIATCYASEHAGEFIKHNGNESAYMAQYNTFVEGLRLYLMLNHIPEVDIRLCAIVSQDDPMLKKKGLVAGFRLFNSILVEDGSTYPGPVSKSDFTLTVIKNM